MSNPKFRASFSVLSQWADGNWERAVKSYFKLEQFTTPAMAMGKEWHEKWAQHTNATGCLPVEFGGAKLKKPITELKTVVSLDDWLDLVFIIDCLDEPDIHEYKTGKQSSEAYANTKQLGVYAVGATLKGYLVKRGIIHHYDQYTKKTDTSIVWLTDKLIDDAHNWIFTIAGEMHDYFIKNELYKRFAKIEQSLPTPDLLTKPL